MHSSRMLREGARPEAFRSYTTNKKGEAEFSLACLLSKLCDARF
jgi:hypothetical protein